MTSIVRRRGTSSQFLVLAIALSSAVGVFVGVAMSQPPIPRRGQKESAPQEQQAQSKDTNPTAATATERGTESAPILVRVTKTAADADREQQDRDDNSRGRWATAGLAALTLLVLIFQWQVMDTQNWIMRRQSRIMKGQLKSTGLAAKAAQKSARIAGQTLYLSMRARIGIKRMTCQRFGPTQRPVFITTIENYGGKGALLRDYCFATTTSRPLPIKPAYLPESQWFPLNSPLEKQAIQDLDCEVTPAITQALWEQIADGTANYVIYGVIRYDAGFGQVKRFGFARQYDRELSQRRGEPVFIAMNTPGYNYAE